MLPLTRTLLDEYKHFSDKRLKDGNHFVVDDRQDKDFGADRQLYPWFCQMFAHVVADDEATLRLNGHPRSPAIEAWVAKNGARDVHLEITLRPGEQGVLLELARLMRAIVAPGARYDEPSNKYVCPRVAESLERLKGTLDRVWTADFTPQPRPTSLF